MMGAVHDGLRARGRDKLLERSGQMTVELCVVLPVVIAIAVIAVNALSFFGYCAEFDRVARNAVRTYATAPAYGASTDSAVSQVETALEEAFDATNLECEVQASRDHRGFESYEMTLRYRPTLFGLGLRSEVFGVPMPALSHESRLTVCPYKPGMLF